MQMTARSYRPSIDQLPKGVFVSDATSQKQDEILANQAKLDSVLANQETIKANQEQIRSNQAKLDEILANQEQILGKIGG
jgi:hypothetical protein